MADLTFACDAMLGSLARWLRFAGFDVHFDAFLDDAALAARARLDGRWLLTRDGRLAAAAGPRALLLASVGVADQLAELRRRLPLSVDPARFLSRCSRCNGELQEARREDVSARVPPFVAAHASRFSACPTCGRVYWPGTHAGRISRTLAFLFEVEAPTTLQ